MPEFARFFDSTAEDLREYTADEFAEYFRIVLTNGIFNGGTNLKASSDGTGRSTNVDDGFAWINGYMYKVGGGHSVEHDVADSTYDRIDRVVLRLDTSLEVRNINAMIITGEPSENPVVPSIVRENNIYDLSLAQVLINANTASIPVSNVTDERLDNNVCGLVNSLIQADTTEIFNQFQAWFYEKKVEYQQDWNDWFTLETYNNENAWDTWFNSVKEEYEQLSYADMKEKVQTLTSDVLQLTFELEVNNIISVDGMKHVFVDTFDSPDEVIVNEGMFAGSKVYI